MQITLESQGHVLLKAENGQEKLIQNDHDWPSLATDFEWCKNEVQNPFYIAANNPPCKHNLTDGTSNCRACKVTSTEFICAARAYLEEVDGRTIDDPGWFAADETLELWAQDVENPLIITTVNQLTSICEVHVHDEQIEKALVCASLIACAPQMQAEIARLNNIKSKAIIIIEGGCLSAVYNVDEYHLVDIDNMKEEGYTGDEVDHIVDKIVSRFKCQAIEVDNPLPLN